MVELSREQMIEMFTTQPLPKNVPELRVFEGMPHAFLQMSSLPECGQGIELARSPSLTGEQRQRALQALLHTWTAKGPFTSSPNPSGANIRTAKRSSDGSRPSCKRA